MDVAQLTPTTVDRRVVDDPRNTDHAWISTVAFLYRLDSAVTPTAGDDAADARWWPAADLDTLTAALAADGEQLYAAHQALLSTALTIAE